MEWFFCHISWVTVIIMKKSSTGNIDIHVQEKSLTGQINILYSHCRYWLINCAGKILKWNFLNMIRYMHASDARFRFWNRNWFRNDSTFAWNRNQNQTFAKVLESESESGFQSKPGIGIKTVSESGIVHHWCMLPVVTLYNYMSTMTQTSRILICLHFSHEHLSQLIVLELFKLSLNYVLINRKMGVTW